MAHGITEQDIFNAADALSADDKRPTQTNVREFLGGGSFATIGPALKKWKEQQNEEHILAEIELPDDVSAAMQQSTAAIWTAAIDAAEQRLMAERDALSEAREELEAQAVEAQEAVLVLEKEAEENNALIEEQASNIEILKSDLVEQKSFANKRFADLEDHQRNTINKVNRLQKDLEVSETKNSSLTDQIDQLKNDKAELKTEHKEALSVARNDYKSSLNELKESHKTAVADMKANHEAMGAELNKKHGEIIEKMQVQINSLVAQVEQLAKKSEKLEEQRDTALKEASDAREMARDRLGEIEILKGQLATKTENK